MCYNLVKELNEINTKEGLSLEATARKDLLAYLENAIQLECDVLEQNTIIDSFTQKSLSNKPTIITLQKPAKPQMQYGYVEKGKAGGTAAVVGGIAGIIFMIFCMTSINNGSTQGIITFLFLIIIGICIWFIVQGSKMLSEYNEIKQKNEAIVNHNAKVQRDYENECSRIDSANQSSRNNYAANYPIWEKSHQEGLAYMSKPLQETKDVLFGLYKKDYIYSKYHNLPALTSIYEYMVTGRCDELSGPHGAYNLYEDEVRKDMVISQLNTIIDNLEQIKQNQFMLYQRVKGIQNEMTSINAEIRQISGYTYQVAQFSALNAYYSALTARNTELTIAYHLLNG